MNRGMKKWAPYKSLNEQSDFIFDMLKKKNKIEKPLIFHEQKEKINNILTTYHQQELNVVFYKDGQIVKINTKIHKIDMDNNRLYFNRYSYISFADLIDIENIV